MCILIPSPLKPKGILNRSVISDFNPSILGGQHGARLLYTQQYYIYYSPLINFGWKNKTESCGFCAFSCILAILTKPTHSCFNPLFKFIFFHNALHHWPCQVTSVSNSWSILENHNWCPKSLQHLCICFPCFSLFLHMVSFILKLNIPPSWMSSCHPHPRMADMGIFWAGLYCICL